MPSESAMKAARKTIDGLSPVDQGEGVYYAFADALDAFAEQARADAIGDVIREGTCVVTVNEGEYSKGWQDAMRFVEGVAKAIRARSKP